MIRLVDFRGIPDSIERDISLVSATSHVWRDEIKSWDKDYPMPGPNLGVALRVFLLD